MTEDVFDTAPYITNAERLRVTEADRDALWNKLGDTQAELDSLREEYERCKQSVIDARRNPESE